MNSSFQSRRGDRTNRTPGKPRPQFVVGTRRTLQDQVYERLREALMSGEFAPAERLTLRDLAERTGTSSMPVREALRRLTSEGALEPLSSGATRVRLLTTKSIGDITEIRLEVEGLAARRAATRMTAEQLAELESVQEQLLQAVRNGDALGEARSNERFHFCIYRAAASEELLKLIEHLWLRIGPYLIALVHKRNDTPAIRKRRYVEHHHELIEAIRARSASRAEKALRADVKMGAEVLVSQFGLEQDTRAAAR